MNKFIVTGFKRTGTTYLASILNSQKDSFCFEFNPFVFKNTKNIKEQNLFNSTLNANFINLGMQGPNLRNINEYQKQENAFIDFFHNKHKTLHAGFKMTSLTPNEIGVLIKRGYKIIHLKRNIKDTLRSIIFRIDKEEKQLVFDLKEYLEKFNFFNLAFPIDKYIIIEYENLIKDKKNELKKLSNFLNFNIDSDANLYHSFNKGRYSFKNNSSYENLNEKNEINNLDKYIKFINGGFELHLSTYYSLKKVKRLLNKYIKFILFKLFR